MPESYAGKINRKLLKKQRIIAAAAGREPADLVGMKIRVPNSSMYINCLTAMGATPMT